MPPIPIYSHSPINIDKAGGITPQTEDGHGHSTSPSRPPPTSTTTHNTYPAAQPGAPAILAPTGGSSVHYTPSPQPTRTQPLGAPDPPPPQPNAFPVPYVTAAPPQATPTGQPAPPQAGGSASTGPYTQQPAYYPPQMSIPAPPAAASQSAQRGTATTVSFGAAATAPLYSSEHPPGYQQNPNASELDRYQRAAQEALERDEKQARSRQRVPSLAQGADGVWGSVKGAMAAAGEKMAAAEEEVWKRINKDS